MLDLVLLVVIGSVAGGLSWAIYGTVADWLIATVRRRRVTRELRLLTQQRQRERHLRVASMTGTRGEPRRVWEGGEHDDVA